MVTLRYGNNEPPALVLCCSTVNNSTYFSDLAISLTSASLTVFLSPSPASPVVALISTLPFISKLMVLSFKA